MLYDTLKTVAASTTTPDGNISAEGEAGPARSCKLVADRKLNENAAAAALLSIIGLLLP